MVRVKRPPPAQGSLLEVRTRTAPCVPAIREKVREWRAEYKGVTETTRALLNYWFKSDHKLPNGRLFQYHDSQREAMETLVYLYEVAGGGGGEGRVGGVGRRGGGGARAP